MVTIADPAIGIRRLTKEEFLRGWVSSSEDGEDVGVLLLMEATPDFYAKEGEVVNKKGIKYVFSYITKYKKLWVQLIIGLIFGSIIQLAFPFLMQALIDVGVETQNYNFLWIVLIAHLILYISQTAVEFIRSWILLHIGTRINIRLVSDYLYKLTSLPIRFFETKMTGDFIQRIYDNQRIEQFLTSSSLFTLFNLFNLVLFGFVLAYYHWQIFFIYLIGTVMYVTWIFFFLRRRKELDHNRFDMSADSQNTLIQLINGMKEIKLHNAETTRRWAWERVQARLFRTNINLLSLDQWQRAGTKFINETKNILITVIAAKAVIEGDMTLGMLVAIQYIVGQLNTPIDDLVLFVHSAQDAMLSLERMGEIHDREDEENIEHKLTILPDRGDITLQNVSFRYGAPHMPYTLQNINLRIPEGQITAIIGPSGSGKTTLLKMLLNFYKPTEGHVRISDINLSNIQNHTWREKIGVVMQESYIFSDTIARNIALGDERINKTRLLYAARIAHIQDFIESLPLAYNTNIGLEGMGLSQGQKQRILIARAVYKNPDYFFFDEATNALDANTEKIVMRNLEQHFYNKTVVIVAHRMSTIKNADNIIVLNKGQIIEEGEHESLLDKKGFYFELIKNQLELR